MTQSEQRVLSDAFALAFQAMTAQADLPEKARALHRRAERDHPDFAPICALFCDGLRQAHGSPAVLAAEGAALRDAVVRSVAFRPVDAARVDIHG